MISLVSPAPPNRQSISCGRGRGGGGIGEIKKERIVRLDRLSPLSARFLRARGS